MFGDERDLSAPMPPESGLPALIDMENETIANADFRRVIWTGLHTQGSQFCKFCNFANSPKIGKKSS